MDIIKTCVISASILIAIGSAFCVFKKTTPIGFGIMAGGATYAIMALLFVIFGI